MELDVTCLAQISLLDMTQHACWDSGAGTGVSTAVEDFVWIDESSTAKDSVSSADQVLVLQFVGDVVR